MKRRWNIVEECNDDNGNPTVWSKEFNHVKYGRYCWITFNGTTYNVEVELHGDFTTLKECKTLASAKSWVTRNL